MGGSPMSGLTLWQAMRPAGSPKARLSGPELWRSLRVHWRAAAVVLAATAALCAVVASEDGPDAIASLQITAPDLAGPNPAGPDPIGPGTARPALAAAAARLRDPDTRLAALYAVGLSRVFPDLLPGDPDARARALARLDAVEQTADLPDGLLISTRLPDARLAAALDRELAGTVLDLPPRPALAAAPPAPDDRLRALGGEEARLQTALDETDRQAEALSARLTDLARDMVAALRVADTRPPTADVLDQAQKLLAELQLQRVELSSKYTDAFPAIPAMDAEIEKLQGFVAAEEHRTTRAPPAANPGFAMLSAERLRVSNELQALNVQRTAMRSRLDTLQARTDALDRTPAPRPAPAPPRLVAQPVLLGHAADPRPGMIAAVALAGLLLAALAPLLRLRRRRVFATPAEVEAALGLPVLRCLDRDGLPVGPVAIHPVPAAIRPAIPGMPALPVLSLRLLPEDRR